MDYKEINELREFVDQNSIEVIIPKIPSYLAGKKYFPRIDLDINNKRFSFFVDDEHKDLKLQNLLLSTEVALRTLENYQLSQDYLQWCTENSFDASIDQVRHHYMDLGSIYKEISAMEISIHSFISDWDFELNAGSAQYLRNHMK